MSATLTWEDDGQTILCCTFEGEFGPENYAVMEGQLPMVIREANHPVWVILFLSRGASFPNLKSILPEIQILFHIMPSNLQGMVGVGGGFLLSNPLGVLVASLFVRRRLNGKLHIARSKAHAIQIARK